jgi:ubiquinone/menaquinone biosynthesis C-methylase UbiE
VGEINLLDRYPRSKRVVADRGPAITDEVRAIARQYGRDYFDGDRRYGYGGYSYHPRFWQDTVRRIRDYYQLPADAHLLDIGCAKGFMLHDFQELMPQATVAGLDISAYAIENALPSMKAFVRVGNAKELPYANGSFDLVLALNTLHNLPLQECKQAVREVARVSRRHAFIVVDAWRTDEQRERMRQWVVTAHTVMHVDDWTKLFAEAGYTGDYYWFIVE